MKLRSGFVSNSSTSSFICSVCGGQEAAGHEVSWDDMGINHVECAKGHEFHEECLTDNGYCVKEDIEEYGYLPTEKCPVCTMKIISDEDKYRFLIKRKIVGKDFVLREITASCNGDYKKLEEIIG